MYVTSGRDSKVLACFTHPDLLGVVATQAIARLVTPISERLADEQTHQGERPEADVNAHAKQRVDERGHPNYVQAVQERNAGHCGEC